MSVAASRTAPSDGALIPPVYAHVQEREFDNRRVIATVEEIAEDGVAIAESLVGYLNTRIPMLTEQHSRLPTAIEDVDTVFSCTKPSAWTERNVLERCKTQLSPADLQRLQHAPRIPAGDVTSWLRSFSGPSELPRREYLLTKENLKHINPHQPASSKYNTSEILSALYDIQFVDMLAHVKEQQRNMDAQGRVLEQRVAEQEAAHTAAQASGDVAAIELAHRRLIAAQYELLEYAAQRLAQLQNSELANDDDSFAKQALSLDKDARQAVKEFVDDKAQARKRVEDDLARCAAALREEEQTHQNAQQAFVDTGRKLRGRIGDNFSVQQRLLNEIAAKAAELQRVTEERHAMVTEFVQAKVAEERRIGAFNDFVDYEQQHVSRLNSFLPYLDDCETVGVELQLYVDDMVKRIPRANIRDTMTAQAREEAKSMHEVYKKFAMCCGDLTTRKAHRLDVLERQARLAQLNRDTAVDSLDPNVTHYRAELENAVVQMKDVEGILNALNATQDAGEKLYSTAEPLVRENFSFEGKTFVHPLRELGIKSVEERRRFVDRSMQYVEDEESQIKLKRTALRKLQSAAEHDQHAVTTAVNRAAAELTSASTTRDL